MNVVRLGAFADTLASSRAGITVNIEEYAILADGRRLVFDRQGFTSQAFGLGGVPDPVDQWTLLTVESIERDVRNTVLPDDDDIAAEHDHDWVHIANCLRELGVDVSPEELMGLPYDVVLSDRLRARLSG
jgi:hypothetical protein